MLVLTRKVGEVCVIGENVTVTVVRVTGNHVRLGITAPAEIPVHRKETLDRIQAHKTQPQTVQPQKEPTRQPVADLADS